VPQRLHFVFSNVALSGYNREVLTNANTNLIMMMDLRGAPIRCGTPEKRGGKIRIRKVFAIQAGWRERKGGVAG